MWPLSIFLLFGMTSPQQNASGAEQDYRRDSLIVAAKTLAQAKAHAQALAKAAEELAKEKERVLKLSQEAERRGILFPQGDTCFTMRTYLFHRQDGNAPVLAGMTTCTSANRLQRKSVNQEPQIRLVPLQEERH